MNDDRIVLLELLAKISKLYPEWRFGQLVANVAMWARGTSSSAVWDFSDQEAIDAIRSHLAEINSQAK